MTGDLLALGRPPQAPALPYSLQDPVSHHGDEILSAS